MQFAVFVGNVVVVGCGGCQAGNYRIGGCEWSSRTSRRIASIWEEARGNRREVQPAVLAIVGKWSRLYQRPLQQSRQRSGYTCENHVSSPRFFPSGKDLGLVELKGTSEGIPEHHPLNYILLSLCLSLYVLFSHFVYFERNTARQDLLR